MNVKSLFSLTIATAVLAAAGCASTKATPLGGKTYPKKPADCAIEIVTQAPQRKFEEVCMLNSRGGQSMFESKSVEGLLPQLKAKACECGADAIIMKNSKEGGYNFAGPADRAEASATAIKYVN